jgi:hypothetical protein
MDLTEPPASRYREAYLLMAKEARYRPQAPGDGMGHVSLTRKQLADSELLQRETTAYALKFNEEENEHTFWIGCSDFCANRAFIWTIKTARALAGGKPSLALDLLNMAVKDVKRAIADRRRQ